MAEAARSQLVESLKSSLKSGRYSDLKITCGADSYNVHQVIVCERTEFCAGAMRFDGQESNDRTIHLPEDDPAIVKLLIQYLYEGEYDPKLPDDQDCSSAVNTTVTPKKTAKKSRASRPKDLSTGFPHTCNEDTYEGQCWQRLCDHHICGTHCHNSCYAFVCPHCKSLVDESTAIPGPPEQLITHAKMYEIADKYGVVGLKGLVIEKFTRVCHKYWEEPAFSIAAHHAFSTTPESDKGLRNIVSETIYEHMSTMILDPSVEALLTEFNGLAYGLLKAKIKAGWK